MDTSILSFHIHHEICHIISIKVVTFSIPIQVSRRRMHLSNALSGRTGRKSWIFICSELWMKPGKLQNTGWRNITASDLMNPWTTWRRKRTDWWRKARNSQKWVALEPQNTWKQPSAGLWQCRIWGKSGAYYPRSSLWSAWSCQPEGVEARYPERRLLGGMVKQRALFVSNCSIG